MYVVMDNPRRQGASPDGRSPEHGTGTREGSGVQIRRSLGDNERRKHDR
jgi:hypothetical protein